MAGFLQITQIKNENKFHQTVHLQVDILAKSLIFLFFLNVRLVEYFSIILNQTVLIFLN